ncbi:hypothetical protein [[Mycobacterium] burgundiense]|uniref:Uncharacterized protein n=1 Tax=[Mycobacterium] burgundiense TaxID=3064286 RepID=A0ABM9LVU7_9MYCO|nr:hypothetical protein [Mycolicibacterium sp. MU0053]CAJ1505592.1 hypothetical protein MU0053_002974 [Mycolicibacterium sp. MU0053]
MSAGSARFTDAPLTRAAHRPLSAAAAIITAMKWIEATLTVELTQRNVQALTDKLSDPLSARTLVSPCGRIMVTAVPGAGAAEAVAVPGVVPLTRAQLEQLAVTGAEVRVAGIRVLAVEDADHYGDRAPGAVYMPSTGEYR